MNKQTPAAYHSMVEYTSSCAYLSLYFDPETVVTGRFMSGHQTAKEAGAVVKPPRRPLDA
jgi:hypothetical protein